MTNKESLKLLHAVDRLNNARNLDGSGAAAERDESEMFDCGGWHARHPSYARMLPRSLPKALRSPELWQ